MKVVTKAKFLDVVFDRTLLYKNHVSYVENNCLKANVVGHTDWGLDRKSLLCFY